MAAAMLQVRDLVAGYGDLTIVDGATLDLREREVVAVIGPNGSGKSTLLKAAFGLVRARSGLVRMVDRDVTQLPTHLRVEAGMGYVPQTANVFPSLTVDENLDVGAHLRRDGVEAARQRVRALFPALRERRAQRVGRMSGGERQMVAIGRALMLEPRVLLLDEPSANLAPKLQDEVFARVRAIADAGTAVLLVEQNARKALAVADRAYVLEQGRSVLDGDAKALLKDPRLRKLYLGG